MGAIDLEPVVPRRWYERPVLPKPAIRIFKSRQSAMRPNPGHSSGCGIILKPAVPGVPAPADVKGRVWDEAVVSGSPLE
jgi:hypothetical protein